MRKERRQKSETRRDAVSHLNLAFTPVPDPTQLSTLRASCVNSEGAPYRRDWGVIATLTYEPPRSRRISSRRSGTTRHQVHLPRRSPVIRPASAKMRVWCEIVG